jgi:hypothetical protein
MQFGVYNLRGVFHESPDGESKFIGPQPREGVAGQMVEQTLRKF